MLIPNRPTEEGRLLGKELARLTDKAELEAVAKFPNTTVRCRTCAFRLGTVPNGCPGTVMDALKCVMEGTQFNCHEDTSLPCMGWIAARYELCRSRQEPMKTPWEFSYKDEGA